MPGIRELRKLLVRGVQVLVLDGHKDLAGQVMFVKSEGLTPCRQRPGQCAEDRKCNKHAVFVCAEDPATLDGGAGWRKGATKVCLSHLGNLDGEPFTAARKGRKTVTEEAPVVELAPITEEQVALFRGENIDDIGEPVSWLDLAYASRAAQTKRTTNAVVKLIALARRLKIQRDELSDKLISTQEDLIAVQRSALDDLLNTTPVAQPVEEIEFDFGPEKGDSTPEEQDAGERYIDSTLLGREHLIDPLV